MKDLAGQIVSTATCIQPRSLTTNAVWTIAANLVRGGCQWGLLVALAKLGTPAMVGQLALGLAISTPLFLLSGLQLRIVQATDAKDDFHFGHYLGLRLICDPLAFVVTIGFAWAAGYPLDTMLVIGAVALSKMPDSLGDCVQGAMQKNERLDMVAVSTIIRNLGSFAVFVGVFCLTGLVSLAALSQAGMSALVFLAYDCPQGARLIGPGARALAPRFEWSRLSGLAGLALPLALIAMIISLGGNLPRYLLERYWGAASLGIFAAIMQPSLAGNIVMTGLGHTVMPSMSRSYASGDWSRLSRLVLRLMGLGCIVGGIAIAVIWGWGREIMTLLYRPGYAEYQDALVWLMVAGTIGNIGCGLGYGLNATRAYHYYLLFYSISGALGALLGFLLIPVYGIKGAAWTICGTYFLSGLFLGLLFFFLSHKGESRG